MRPVSPDPRRRVDERDLAEPLRVRDRREVAREPVAVGVALRAQAHEAPVAELAREVLDHAAAEAARARAAERPLGRAPASGEMKHSSVGTFIAICRPQ